MSIDYPGLQRLLNIIIGPNQKIKSRTQRKLASLLSAFHLASLPFVILTILFADLLNNVEQLIFVVIIAALVLYLISRTQYFRFSVGITVILYTFVPILIWFTATNWQAYDIPRVMAWIIVALALGAFFTDERIVLLQGLTISSIIVIIAGVIYGIPLAEYDAHLLTVAVLSLIAIIFSRLTRSYLDEMNKQSIELKNQNRDLEIYTGLLRHDLSNDLQAIINSIEYSQMLIPINMESVNESLEQSLNFSIRMQKLLHIFRLPLEEPSANLVEDIKKIAAESERTHGNLNIEVSWTKEAEREAITASRLLSLVWTNIFRNASQHAGAHPIVKVNISIVNHDYQVIISDNGPGIPAGVSENLFKRDANPEESGKGIGLYLSRLIIESHGGTIERSDTPETQFVIRLPAISGHSY